MEKSLLQVVPIDPMVKDVYRPKNVCRVGNYNMHTHLLLWLFILNSTFPTFFLSVDFFFNCSWRMSNGSIGQGILRADKYFTDGELTNPVKDKWN